MRSWGPAVVSLLETRRRSSISWRPAAVPLLEKGNISMNSRPVPLETFQNLPFWLWGSIAPSCLDSRDRPAVGTP